MPHLLSVLNLQFGLSSHFIINHFNKVLPLPPPGKMGRRRAPPSSPLRCLPSCCATQALRRGRVLALCAEDYGRGDP